MIFNVLRKIAMNLYRQDETIKASLKQKRKIAAYDDDFRETLLESIIKMRLPWIGRTDPDIILKCYF